MFYLHVSNRTENLLQHLSSLFQAQPPANIFSPELFLIQSQGMERLIVQHLAGSFRCFTNYRFFQPIDFFAYIGDALGFGITPDGFDRSVLAWRIEALLREVDDGVYGPVATYLAGENRELKRLQLSRRLAHLFDQYQIMRPEMLDAWRRGCLATDHPDEPWQLKLWNQLLAQDPADSDRSSQFQKVILYLQQCTNLRGKLPQRVSVIGLHTMPPIFIHYLRALADHMDIHLLLLSPSQKYWGDVSRRRAKNQVREGAVSEDGAEGVANPFLGALGGQGRDFLNLLLNNIQPAGEFSSYVEPGDVPGQGLSFLQRLQTDILMNQPGTGEPARLDESLSIVSCHSRMRELMVLKDHLLARLDRDPTLELRDIVVMAPDIQQYSSLIPAIFQDFPHSIADRSLRRRNRVVNCFLTFLVIAAERCGWQEVMDLLGQSPVREHFRLTDSDLDILREWVVASGIRWGLSGEHRQQLGSPAFVENSWCCGLERMLLGYAIDHDDFVAGILPFGGVEGKSGQLVGVLCSFVALLERTRQESTQDRTLSGWSEMLFTLTEGLFGTGDSRDHAELRDIIGSLAEVSGGYHQQPVEFVAIYEWLRMMTEESRSSSGFLRGQLTFCSMLPMRSIPFRTVCLLGLNDGEFPRSDFHDTFDLLGVQHIAGDRSPRGDDRYQFLEAILAARSQLYLSYVGQCEKTNEERPPSVLLADLLQILRQQYQADGLVIKHPLHPFSRRYFQQPNEAELFSYSEHNCRICSAMLAPGGQSGPWWRDRMEHSVVSVDLHELLRFFKDPQRYFLRSILGIRQERSANLVAESEPFNLSGLERYAAEQQLFASENGDDAFRRITRLQASGLWPLGSSGILLGAQTMRRLEPLREQIVGFALGAPLGELAVSLEVGDRKVVGNLGNQYEQGVLLVRLGKLRGCDLLGAWLHHCISSQIRGSVRTVLICKDSVFTFDQSSDEPPLSTLVDIFADGCTRVSPLFTEAAYVYAKVWVRNKDTHPRELAEDELRTSMEKEYNWAWEIVLRGGIDDILSEEFFRLSKSVFAPLVEGGR